jgi:RNA polymerase sigma-70 factor (ECF subfamily)
MEATTDTDTALVERMGRGDEQALAAIYDRHGRTAYALAVRILRDPHLAEDAVQEAFLGLWRSAAAFDASRSAPATYLHVLVHRRAVDLVRREERRRVAAPEVGSPIELSVPSTEDVALLRETRARVRAALDRLTGSQHQVLELAYYGGLSQSEVAERLGLPLGTVKSRTHAALMRLQEILDEVPGERSLSEAAA